MTGGPWLDADQAAAWRAHLAVQARLTERLHRDLQDRCGLSLADYDVLVALTDRAGDAGGPGTSSTGTAAGAARPEARLRPFELVEALQWEKSRLSKQVARMVERGLVAREDCPEDRRGAYVVLTGAGRAALEAAAPGHAELVRTVVFDPLSPQQVAAWTTVSRSVLAALGSAVDHAGPPSGPPSGPLSGQDPVEHRGRPAGSAPRDR